MRSGIQIALLISFTFSIKFSKAQNNNKLEPIKQAVIVSKSEKRILKINQSYFEGQYKGELLQQITQEQLEEVKKYSNPKLCPTCVKQALQCLQTLPTKP